MVIKRVGALSCARVAGVLYVIMGFVFGAFLSAFGGLYAGPGGTMGSTLFGPGAIVALPIFYGVLGFVFTLVGATLFNLVVGLTGGIEVDVS